VIDIPSVKAATGVTDAVIIGIRLIGIGNCWTVVDIAADTISVRVVE
jgi:hypothetical protein